MRSPLFRQTRALWALAITYAVCGFPAAGAQRALADDIAIRTTAGTIVVRLDVARAPLTARNFLHYVDTNAYQGATFYRVVRRATTPEARFEVVQGGLNPQTARAMVTPIALESTAQTGLHNVDGAIAMARTSDPNSATTEFFIDVGDARYLDAGGPLGPGYAVFGRVVRGMDVVRKIHGAPASGESLAPAIRMLSITRATR
ncbi:MAG: peptidylprolyl isomerase [Candidatus Velthaea sp.]